MYYTERHTTKNNKKSHFWNVFDWAGKLVFQCTSKKGATKALETLNKTTEKYNGFTDTGLAQRAINTEDNLSWEQPKPSCEARSSKEPSVYDGLSREHKLRQLDKELESVERERVEAKREGDEELARIKREGDEELARIKREGDEASREVSDIIDKLDGLNQRRMARARFLLNKTTNNQAGQRYLEQETVDVAYSISP